MSVCKVCGDDHSAIAKAVEIVLDTVTISRDQFVAAFQMVGYGTDDDNFKNAEKFLFGKVVMRHVYIAYQISEDWCHTVGVYSTFDLAKAGLHRYMNDCGLKVHKYKWDNEQWSYHVDDDNVFNVSKVQIDK